VGGRQSLFTFFWGGRGFLKWEERSERGWLVGKVERVGMMNEASFRGEKREKEEVNQKTGCWVHYGEPPLSQ